MFGHISDRDTERSSTAKMCAPPKKHKNKEEIDSSIKISY